jgi:hypothetical protein
MRLLNQILHEQVILIAQLLTEQVTDGSLFYDSCYRVDHHAQKNLTGNHHPVMVAVDFTEAEGYCTEKKVSDFTVPSRDENGDRKITHLFLQCGSPSI